LSACGRLGFELVDDAASSDGNGETVARDEMHDERVATVDSARATVCYLPKYSPALNPIEIPFSKFKAFLRKVSERIDPGLYQTIRSFVPRLSAQEFANHWRRLCFNMIGIGFRSRAKTVIIEDLGRHQKALYALLGISLVIRLILVLHGGEFYYPDEYRYLRSFALLDKLSHFNLRDVCDYVLGEIDHNGSIFTGLPAALVQNAFIAIRGLPPTQSSVFETVWLSGLFFAIPSVISITLVYAISRRAAATSAEALLAAFLMACSNAMFYYCRHLLPYDSSMALALVALWLGLSEKPTTSASFSCGFIAGLAVMTYYGYWITGAVVIAIHVFYGVPTAVAALKRAVPAALGAISLPIALNVSSTLFGKAPFLSEMGKFAESVKQGDFREGDVLPILYLWDTEHALALTWAAATLLALWYFCKDNRRPSFVVFCIATILATYGLLVLGSVGIGKFVVYGRLVRQMIPWLCFTSAYGIARLFQQGSKYRNALVTGCIALVIQAGWNMSYPLRQVFPADVRRTVDAQYGSVNYDVSFNGPVMDGSPNSVPSPYVLLNAQFLYRLLSWKAPISGEVLFSAPHPLAYRPYQYEGLDPRKRDLLQHGDYSMRLIRRRSN
jgi:hypothetical protein